MAVVMLRLRRELTDRYCMSWVFRQRIGPPLGCRVSGQRRSRPRTPASALGTGRLGGGEGERGHRNRCGALTSGAHGDDAVWMSCSCGATILVQATEKGPEYNLDRGSPCEQQPCFSSSPSENVSSRQTPTACLVKPVAARRDFVGPGWDSPIRDLRLHPAATGRPGGSVSRWVAVDRG